ncbi:class A beta-lactamase [Curtobacterium sp. MCPF17_002]|uniref:class A beta-lactamase n=1 Tax=Curtobacterium sp. MCPF17_002 TaxID=2175645 RepID=UPI000DA736C6|nr:class A beta-lactamase [Curtobacterium sp. MCPF17_002]WIB77937.1 class A beta-lactamase [Curtobacterium sp. MCPF17_002]
MHRSLSVVAVAVALALTAAACSSGGPTSRTASASASGSPARTPSPTPTLDTSGVEPALAALESEYGATIGVVATDTVTGASVSHNRDRRFGYASSIKAFAAAEFLRSVHGADRDERVRWTAADVAAAGHSPVTEQHVADGLSYDELAEAAVRQSDNTALNLVLTRIGGPSGLDAALADLGDDVTRVLHDEPELNTIEPGSTEDTTTPAAFAADLATVLDGDTLSGADTDQLVAWMSGNATGDTLIRAGAPEGWTVADKSGGAGGIRNDVALVTPPGGHPIAVAVLTTKNDPGAVYDDTLVAKTAAVVLDAFQR